MGFDEANFAGTRYTRSVRGSYVDDSTRDAGLLLLLRRLRGHEGIAGGEGPEQRRHRLAKDDGGRRGRRHDALASDISRGRR